MRVCSHDSLNHSLALTLSWNQGGRPAPVRVTLVHAIERIEVGENIEDQNNGFTADLLPPCFRQKLLETHPEVDHFSTSCPSRKSVPRNPDPPPPLAGAISLHQPLTITQSKASSTPQYTFSVPGMSKFTPQVHL